MPPKAESSNKIFLKLKFMTPGTLNIIESIQLSWISRFSAYSKPEAKYHSPGLLLGIFSEPVGIEKVPGTCYQLVGNLSPSKYDPGASKDSKSCTKWIPNDTQNRWKIHLCIPWARPNLKLSPRTSKHCLKWTPGCPKAPKMEPNWHQIWEVGIIFGGKNDITINGFPVPLIGAGGRGRSP